MASSINSTNRDTTTLNMPSSINSTNGDATTLNIARKDRVDECVTTLRVANKNNLNKDDTRDPSFCQQVCSSRMLVFVLLQFSIVTCGLPRTTFNMAFVCSASRRLQALEMVNRSGPSSLHHGQPALADQLWSNGSARHNNAGAEQ
ncbi:hypothetical protein ElyMa_006854900, partial [Elysia marginata]